MVSRPLLDRERTPTTVAFYGGGRTYTRVACLDTLALECKDQGPLGSRKKKGWGEGGRKRERERG